ncbi:carbohydrate binding domain-containing protein [Pedobacter cryophilus]|uniref:CBM-cenC domain-containing protein n=1 Tax=Pedobacter cryophilus TaxID=2571271 RepID=A0A4U1C404_9SPHI|nr:carbohydrate binding domain-containing protein [Pedobacter cryophilus]TKB99076.1 hypothetical protein FA046_08170 [Pedobacter cryophilus]
MKKLFFIAIIIAPMLLNAQNLVINGDFETVGATPQNFANWTHSPTYSNIAKETSATKINGLSSVRFTANTSAAYITSDAITVEPGKTYRLKFTGRIHKTAGTSGTLETSEDAALKLSVLIWNGTKTSPSKFPVLSITSATNKTVSGEFKIPAAGVTAIKLVFGKNKDVAYADDVVLVELKK